MSQFTFANIDEANTDGFDLADMLEDFEAAINSMHAGDTAPGYKITGMPWRDTSGTPHLIKMWTGGTWITTGSLNTGTGIFTPYFQGAVQTIISTLSIGEGLENASGALRVKLKNSTLERDGSGLALPSKGLTPGIYTGADVTVNEFGIITAIQNGANPIEAVTPGGNYVGVKAAAVNLPPPPSTAEQFPNGGGGSATYTTGYGTLTQVSRLYVKRPGTVRCGFTLNVKDYPSSGVQGFLYLNNVSVYNVYLSGTFSGPDRTGSYYYDIAVQPGDIIDWWGRFYRGSSTVGASASGNMYNAYAGVSDPLVPAWPFG